ncbi:hypothetical protein PIB30_068586 [Stylosanthes scabra]|uniref:Uncharacterized protein n=1 Tax=Stylosanthes scabra TaxID=79078 RepID=A0ABU6QMG2_9FABA|nr:hypothetical protein [Stylosanthes scabra]
MARTPLFTSLSLFFTLFLCTTPFDVVLGSKGSLEWLKVPHAEFANSVKEVIGVLHSVTSVLRLQSEFVRKDGGYVDDPHLSSAVSACLELMELSSDELNRVVSIIESPKASECPFQVPPPAVPRASRGGPSSLSSAEQSHHRKSSTPAISPEHWHPPWGQS